MHRLLTKSLQCPLMRQSMQTRGRRLQPFIASAADLFPKATEVVPSGRPSRNAKKREAKAMLEVTRAMCELSERQLTMVLPLLQPYIAEELMIARGIQRRNQARSRQENLVGRMLRELPDEEQLAIQAGVEAAANGQSGASSAADDLAVYWRDQLAANNKANSWVSHILSDMSMAHGGCTEVIDCMGACSVAGCQDVMHEVFTLASACEAVGVSELRQLVRQLQQQIRNESQSAAAEGAEPEVDAADTWATVGTSDAEAGKLLGALPEQSTSMTGDPSAAHVAVDGDAQQLHEMGLSVRFRLSGRAKAANKALLRALRQLAVLQTQ